MPETGASPTPFVEKVPTFNVRVKDGRVLVHPKPNPAGTRAEPALIEISQTERSVLTAPQNSPNDGEPVNKQVLNLVAEPVEITGEVERQGELLILRADPATYRRVSN